MNSSQRNKNWHITKSKKVIRTLQKKNRRKNRARKNARHFYHTSVSFNGFRLTAPKHLSLLNNTNETLEYFAEAIDATKNCKVRQRIYFDLEHVEIISPDAIMYLLALIKNVKRVKSLKIICEGNLPVNPEARALIINSGFYEYVSSKQTTRYTDSSSRIRITSGDQADGPLIGEICDFVIGHSHSRNPLQTKRLYPMILELMTNTKQHAYQNELVHIMDDKWYLYVEDTPESIDFVFLDTGVGIPTTIRLNFAERVIKLFLNNKNDAKFISSALKGDFRTETNLEHRGKGLPCILEDSKSGNIYGLTIISGKGQCIIDSDYNIIEKTSSLAFKGTLFSWKYRKKEAVR